MTAPQPSAPPACTIPTCRASASGFNVVFECSGVPGMVQAAVDAAGVRGHVVIAGVCLVPDQIVPVVAIMKEVDVSFAVYYRGSEFTAAADLLASGALDADVYVSRRVGLDGVGDADAAVTEQRAEDSGDAMTERFAGKVALVTGGSTGIGAAIVERFVSEGGAVVACARNEPQKPFTGRSPSSPPT